MVIGSINVDLFAHVARHPVPGETVLGTGGERAPGGKGANQALAARLQGAEVRLVGAVGDDADANVALGLLRAAGVDLSGVTVTPGWPTGLAIITVAEDGENTIVVVSGANSALPTAHALAVLDELDRADVVLMQGELDARLTALTVEAAAQRGHRVVHNLAPFAELPVAVLQHADPLVVNEVEGAAVARQLGVTAEDEHGLVAGLVSAGVRSVALTLGARGCLVADGAGVTAVPGVRVEAVDTTGAGDAFAGALAARLAEGDPLREAAARATRVGAFAVQQPGAQPSYPSLEDDLP